ncbi:unnamed protein product [Lymnaea stagnalis]|uniref:Uncharacterized protein n=1 Tax=Lymnaea stagnalis TaxID=6523 RepID=A0AAV2IDS8_LYMST
MTVSGTWHALKSSTALLALLLWTCRVQSVQLPMKPDVARQLLGKVSGAVRKAIHFFGEDYSSINVDGLFGIRLCQGALMGSKADCQSGRLSCPEDLITELDYYIRTMSTFAEKALSYIEAEDGVYFGRFHETIDKPYTINCTYESLGDNLPPPGSDHVYIETDGDVCFSKILGTYQEDGRSYPRCSLSPDCWTLMTKGGMREYAITHQLLYFVLSEKGGCLPLMNEYLAKISGTTVRQFQKQLCRTIYSEASELEHEGKVNELKQDLFLEQSVLCGTLGFEEFYSEKWIRMVLGWQRGRGCYGLPQGLTSIEANLSRIQEDERDLLERLSQEADRIDHSAVGTGRKLLREKVMTGDCLSHKTGLAFGTLGVYFRYLINQVYG